MGTWETIWCSALFACLPLGCTSNDSDDGAKDPDRGGTAGQGAAPTSGSTGGGIGGGGSGLGGGGSGGADGGGGMIMLDPQPTCEFPAIACNGACIDAGESANGCTYIAHVGEVKAMAIHEGDLYASLTFRSLTPDSPLPIGVYRFDGSTLVPTPLDTEGTRATTAFAFAGESVFYLSSQDSNGPGALRSVPLSGGTPAVLVTDLDRTNDLLIAGDRAYYAASLRLMGELEAIRWVPLSGGTASPTELLGVNRARTNGTLIAVSWNGDIRTGVLPEGAPQLEVMTDFELPGSDSWWIDDTFAYWQRDANIKRAPLSMLGVTDEQGELVQTLPEGLSFHTDIGAELLLTISADDATGVYTMPRDGGTPQKVAVVGAGRIERATFDANHVYVSVGIGFLRLDR